MIHKFFDVITVRSFKLGLVTVGILFFAYLTLENPSIWMINLIIWPLGLLVVFDRGHAKAIDRSYKAVKHLKGKSDRADLMITMLCMNKLNLAKTHLISLEHDFPEEKESIEIAMKALNAYLEKEPWWHKL
jgi:hypothetical protein